MKKGLALIMTISMFVLPIQAQMLAPDGTFPIKAAAPTTIPAGSRNTAPQKSPEPVLDDTLEQINQSFQRKNDVTADDPLSQISQALNNTEKTAEGVAAAEAVKQQEEEIFIPEGELYRLNTPTFDGSSRGGQAFVEVDEKGRMKKIDNIFLFYDKFKITSYLSDSATCDVRFNILSNLDRKINALDIKLVWPEMTTALSFSDVKPNTQTYYNYSLIGNGCYNMDKAPNIIVNRCRIKGMTAAECANKLVWLSK